MEDFYVVAAGWMSLVKVPLIVIPCLVTALVFGRLAYLPPLRSRESSLWVGHGIFIGFLFAGLNELFWGVKWYAQALGYLETSFLISKAGGFVDPFLKLPILWAAHCHLYARYLAFPPDVRRRTFWLCLVWGKNCKPDVTREKR